MKALKRVGLGLVALVVLLLVVGLFLPGEVEVARTRSVEAPPCNVYALVSGFGRFGDYAPWSLDAPQTRAATAGPVQGVGARLTWESEDPGVGSGSQEVVVAEPCRRVETRLEFEGMGGARSTWLLDPAPGGTEVTWSFSSELGWNPVTRWFGLFMDGAVGDDYAEGLARLETLVERHREPDLEGLAPEVQPLEPRTVVAREGRAPVAPEDRIQAVMAALDQVAAWMQGANVVPAGAPVAITVAEDPEAWLFHAGYPVRGEPPALGDAPLRLVETPEGDAVRVVHRGSWSALDEAWAGLATWMELVGLAPGGARWEEYISDPELTPEAQRVTHLYQPVAAP